jgi:hypothetical protein
MASAMHDTMKSPKIKEEVKAGIQKEGSYSVVGTT